MSAALYFLYDYDYNKVSGRLLSIAYTFLFSVFDNKNQ